MKISKRGYRASLNCSGATAVIIAAALMPVSSVYAQDSTNDEIIVTARKVSENIQDVPVSITAFTADALTNSGIVEFADVSKMTPNFTALPQGAFGTSFPSLTIRAQTAGGLTLNADQAVGVYVNGAPVNRAVGFFSNMYDVEQIEVLKGPQGTLYGKNTTGGAINVTTVAPKLNEVSGYGQVTAGNFNRYGFQGAVNVPIVEDKLAARFAAMATHRDGFGRGAVTGRQLADDKEMAVRGSVLFMPSETVTMRLTSGYHESDEHGSINRSTATVLGGLLSLESTDPDIYVGNEFGTVPQVDTFKEFNLSLNTTIEFDAFQLDLISSYREHDVFYEYRRIPLTGNVIAQDAEMLAQEVRFSGKALSDRLQWQAGAFYSSETGSDTDFLPQFAQYELTTADNSGWAIFTQNTFAITNALNATFGLRYTDEHREAEDLEPGAPVVFAEADFDAVSWIFGLDYKPSDDLMLYVNASKGFRSGGLDLADLSQVIRPEFARNYEAGVKSDLFDNKWRLNLSGYYTDYTDIQRTSFDPDPNIVSITPILRNIAEATILGFELESVIKPIEGLTLSQTVGLTDAKYDSYTSADAAGNLIDRSDDPFPGASWQVSVSGRYEFDYSDTARVGMQANYFWISEDDRATAALAVTLNAEQMRLDSYGTLNAQIDVDLDYNGGLNVALFATNLADKEYYSAAIITSLGALGTISDRIVGSPRTWGVRVKKDF